MREVQVSAQSIDRFRRFAGDAAVDALKERIRALRPRLGARVAWNINSTAKGGGVAELLHSVVGYSRGLGIDSRWAVITGPPEFFALTKLLHNALHGTDVGRALVEPASRHLYERVLLDNVEALCDQLRGGDVLVLHDPQTAGLIPVVKHLGVKIVWRCHVGSDWHNPSVEMGWKFLEPYLQGAHRFVFSRATYPPPFIDRRRLEIVAPTIDPVSSKNVELPAEDVRAILVQAGILEGPVGGGRPVYRRDDGSPDRVDRAADIMRLGRAPKADAKLVTQISRWDRLKDPVGVLHGFAMLVDPIAPADAQLILAGPNVHAVADDPEGAEVFQELATAWRQLPHHVRSRVHLLNLPMTDVEENAAIVNALQRHSTVVVQKSLREGFGLTVAEAMWKSRPVVASAVGGIQDQIEDGVSGLLLRDPTDLRTFGELLRRVLSDAPYATLLGQNARKRVTERFLLLSSLNSYAKVIGALLDEDHEGASAPTP